jgi:prepilin-type N-terminal cleavage/methylation domain-containing protein
MHKFFNTKLNKFNKPEKGFTIVELLVVIAIIAVLAAIALPLFFDNTAKAAQATVKSDVKNTVTAITAALVEDSTLGTEALQAEAVITGDNIITVGGSGYDFTVTGSSTDPRLSEWAYSYVNGVYSETDGNGGGDLNIGELPRVILTSETAGWSVLPNGITITCDDVNNGDSATFTIDGQETIIVKRDRDTIINDVSLAPTSCTTGITDMWMMFLFATDFNQDISHWDTSNVTDMSSMFFFATDFNQDISHWDTSNVTDMSSMFDNADAFNQNIGGWDVSNATFMDYMFAFASDFNQDLSMWCVTNITSIPSFFDYETNAWNKTNRQPVWGTCPAP